MVVLADTEILADSPNELKAAGYGDIMAKYLAIVDWKAANYTTGESARISVSASTTIG